MNRRGMLVLALAVAISAAACGGGSSAASAPRNSSLISIDELQSDAIQSLSVHDAIQRLRPTWLRARGATSVNSGVSQFPSVLMNGSIDHNLDRLRSMRVTDVGEIRFIDSRDATTRYGTGLVNGLIEVVIRSGGR